MILVTLGTQDKGFERLLKAIEHEIEVGTITDKVFVQAGYTKYESDKMEIVDYVSNERFNELMKEADLVITHGGAGSILSAIKNNKPVIAAARLKKYKEHANDHQRQIIKEFSDAGYIIELRDFNKLGKMIEKAKNFKGKAFTSNTQNIIDLIENYIEEDNHTSWYNKVRYSFNYMFFGLILFLIDFIAFKVFNSYNFSYYLSSIYSLLVTIISLILFNFIFGLKLGVKKLIIFILCTLLLEGLGIYFINKLFSYKLYAKVISTLIAFIGNFIVNKVINK